MNISAFGVSKFVSGITILLCLLFATPVLAAPATDTLMGYWKFDESIENSCAGGDDVCDSSGDGNHGTYEGGATTSTTTPSTSFSNPRSLSLDGTDDYIDFGSVNAVGSSDFTLAVWFNTSDDDAASQALIGKQGNGYLMYLDVFGRLRFNLTDGNSFVNDMKGGNIRNGEWRHVAITFDRDENATFYLDGEPIGTTDISSLNGPLGDSGSLDFGQSGNNLYFHGLMDEARIYSRVLSADEVAELAAGDHTSATWDGADGFSYETAAHWDIDAIPDPYTNIIIPDGSTYFTANESLASLTIESGATFSPNAWDLTINDEGAFSNEGTFQLYGDETLTGFTNDTDSGEVEYREESIGTGLTGGDEYYDLTFDSSSSWTLDAPLDVNNDLTIHTAIVDADGNDITVGGNWTNEGTFTANSNTVTLDGTDQEVMGSTTFYNLIKSVNTADTLTFEADETQTIEGTLTLTGAEDNLLSLRSDSLGTAFKIDPQGTRMISYVDVEDSNNINATEIEHSDTITYGDNLTGWDAGEVVVQSSGGGGSASSPHVTHHSDSSSHGDEDSDDEPDPESDSGDSALQALQRRRDELEALLAALQASSAKEDNTPAPIFTRDLFVGMSDEEVRTLQHYLNTHGFPLAESGPGSPNNETDYFGELTRAAVSQFQIAHGITPANGYFGPITRGIINN